MALELLSVTNASIAVLGIPLSTLSLQDALFPESGTAFTDSPYSGAPYIFADACTLGDGSQNCTTACSLGGTMFANLQNLHNCMTFQTLSEHYEAKNLTKEATALVETLSIHATSPNSSLTLNITQQIQTCLVDYCASLPLCKDRYSTVDPYTSYDYISPYAPNSTFDLYRDGIGLVDNICISVPAPINSEIGGIGVYISYWIQTGLAFLGFLATILYDFLLYYGYISALAIPHGFRRASEKAQYMHLANKRHLSRLTVALIDFQKAQSLFMCAINIAALVVIRNRGLDPKSIDQLSATYIFTKVIALGGILPITFTLFTLHLVDMCSWYLILLSSFSIALSTATLVTLGTFNPSKGELGDLSANASSGGPPSCGSWQPGAYCYYSNGPGNAFLNQESFSMLGFCLVVLFLLMIKQSRIFTTRPAQFCLSWLSTKLSPCLPVLVIPARVIHRAIHPIKRRMFPSTNNAEPFDRYTDYPMIMLRVFVAALYLLFTGLYIYYFFLFCSNLATFVQYNQLTKTWNFGQVVAIMVWAQPLCEYLHLEFRGMKAAMDHRIVPPYRLIREEEDIIVVGGAVKDDTQIEGYTSNERKSASDHLTPADGYSYHKQTGYDNFNSSDTIHV